MKERKEGTCRWCGQETTEKELCLKCLKLHDMIVKMVAGILFILSVISLAFYYFEFVA